MASLRGIEPDDQKAVRALERELSARRKRPRARPVPGDAAGMRGLLREEVEPLFVAGLRARHAQYRRDGFYDDQVGKMAKTLADAAGGRTWDEVIDRVRGTHAVPVLTIHKSKGLEYTAVFFVGLEDGAFWNMRKEQAEETNAFFVALSRTKQRVAFTFCAARVLDGVVTPQRRTTVAPLYELLQGAGVELVRHDAP